MISRDKYAIRRAAGTQTFLDVLKIWFAGKRPSPAQDVEDYEKGVGLEVSCSLRPRDGTESRYRFGTLVLNRADPVTWGSRRGERISLVAPKALSGNIGDIRNSQWIALVLETASGSFDIKIPSMDGELVEHALRAAHNERRDA